MSINPSKELELDCVHLDDVDRFSQWEIGLGWDIESTQLSAGANALTFNHFLFPELLVGRFTCKKSMQNRFSIPDGMVMFLICRDNAKKCAFWNGRYMPPTLMAIVRAGHEHWAVLPDGWDCYEFMVSEKFIWHTEVFPKNFYTQTALADRAFLPLMEPVTARFLKGMDAFFNQQAGTPESPRIAVDNKQFLDFIVSGLLQIVDAGLSARDEHKLKQSRRPDLVKKTADLVAGHLQAELSMDDLARTLGVSHRVLTYAFKNTLGISPYQYILTEKLHAVRRALKNSDLSVSDACYLFGFNTPSRFTRHYKRLFGELPSATRKTFQTS